MDNWRIKQLTEMLDQDPSDQFVRYALGQEYLKLEQFEKSAIFFEQLRTINSNYVGLYYHLAAAYIELGEEQKALNIYSIGINIATTLKDHHALAELKNAKLNYELQL